MDATSPHARQCPRAEAQDRAADLSLLAHEFAHDPPSQVLKMLNILKLANLANFTKTGKTRIIAADRGWRVKGHSSGQDRSDVRTAQMPLPVPLADPMHD